MNQESLASSVQLPDQVARLLSDPVAIGFVGYREQTMVEAWARNFMVSNVPGPTRPLYMQGAKIEDVMPFLPLFGNETLTFMALSYCGPPEPCIHGCRAACPDAEILVRGMNEAWQHLSHIAAGA